MSSVISAVGEIVPTINDGVGKFDSTGSEFAVGEYVGIGVVPVVTVGVGDDSFRPVGDNDS